MEIEMNFKKYCEISIHFLKNLEIQSNLNLIS